MEAKKILDSFISMGFGGGEPAHAPRVFEPKENFNMPAEVLKEASGEPGVEALAMLPGALEVTIPEAWKPGDQVPAQGPHGRILLELPTTVEAGKTIQCQLRPSPDLVIEVPEGATAGTKLTFQRPDGTRIRVEVPTGKRSGETFEVRPPALMIMVPEGVEAGSFVVFRAPGTSHAARKVWFRAQVPSALQLGRYFAARMPPTEKIQAAARGLKKEKGGDGEEVALLNDTQPDVVEFFDADATAIAAEDRAVEAAIASSSDIE